ncbi:MAG: hypothetical protein QQW96_05385 [Tychonema bourrellyi B0820]|uniref:hypothetical protein n=1 Tax=Tychonema bourrellyi TaxID=54313 RepID=UPI0015D4A7C3|nr:hypothetical protein [Tychonema bourrellyi]MDQ2097064.1 hypothetical protein [Tychonema bourrellyi B0820]
MLWTPLLIDKAVEFLEFLYVEGDRVDKFIHKLRDRPHCTKLSWRSAEVWKVRLFLTSK